MVDSVSSFTPTDFLKQIKSTPAAPTPAATTGTTTTGTGSTTAASTDTTTSTNDAVTLASTLVSLISNLSSSSTSSTLTGSLLGSSSTDPLAGVYNNLMFSKSTTNPLNEALAAVQQKQADTTATTSNAAQDLVNARNTASNAYNNTLIQNAQNAVAATKKGLIA